MRQKRQWHQILKAVFDVLNFLAIKFELLHWLGISLCRTTFFVKYICYVIDFFIIQSILVPI